LVTLWTICTTFLGGMLNDLPLYVASVNAPQSLIYLTGF
jgi:hypothetical protein